ncbi:MAG TPA: dienelactone hydrolase family protein [Fimbriimonas sp.]|nr:dienelactone hydrolase family protein [Fimbriimonas sp.]
MSQFAADKEFLAIHFRPLPFKFRSGEGKPVSYPDANGHDVGGYYVAPKPGVHTDIVMVHEFWGLNDYIRRQAVKLHDETGYGVLAVDLYGGKVATDAAQAGHYMEEVKSDEATAAVKGAVKALTSGVLGDKATKIGTIGWCFGGGWSLQTAINGGSVVKACVMYYGMPDDDPEHLAKLHAPVLLMEAMQDRWISPEVVGKFKTAMANAHRRLTVETYDANHAFANPSNQGGYDRAAAEDADAKTLKFFRKYLG